MIPIRPLGAGNPEPLDLDAAAQLERSESGRLELVRARAEKWIAGISALGGLLGTVLVFKGPDTLATTALGWRIAVAVILAAALILLGYGTYRAYQAAFGDPSALKAINRIPLTGLHARLFDARRVAATEALAHLGSAVKSVFGAVGLMTAAIGVAWFAPTTTTTTFDQRICVYTDGRFVVQLAGRSADVERSVPGTTVGPCP